VRSSLEYTGATIVIRLNTRENRERIRPGLLRATKSRSGPGVGFVAPQIFENGSYEFPVDVYAYAMLATKNLFGSAAARRMGAPRHSAVRSPRDGRPTFGEIAQQLCSAPFATRGIDAGAFAHDRKKVAAVRRQAEPTPEDGRRAADGRH
jgi:hypothetical protein